MSNEILDDTSNYWQTIISTDKITGACIVLVGVFFSYVEINNWYSFHQTKELILALTWYSEPEIVYPCRIFSSVLTCFYGIRLILEKIRARTAIGLSILTLVGVYFGTLFLF